MLYFRKRQKNVINPHPYPFSRHIGTISCYIGTFDKRTSSTSNKGWKKLESATLKPKTRVMQTTLPPNSTPKSNRTRNYGSKTQRFLSSNSQTAPLHSRQLRQQQHKVPSEPT